MKRRGLWVVLGLAVLAAAGAAAWAFDPDARLRGWAGGDPFYRGRAGTAWRHDLAGPDEVKATAARDALAAGKAEAVPVCVWVVTTAPEPAARVRAVEALAAMGPDADRGEVNKETPTGSAALIAALADPDPLVRGAAARAVGERTPDAGTAVPALVKLFPDVDAVRAVSKYKAAGGPAVPKLTELLRHDDAAVRWQAGRTLGKIGVPALPALPELARQMASDPDALVREHAAEALGDIGPAAAAAVPDLAKALKDPAFKVRRDAVRSLGQMGPAAKGALTDVQALLTDPEEIVRTAAATSARQIDPTAKVDAPPAGKKGPADED